MQDRECGFLVTTYSILLAPSRKKIAGTDEKAETFVKRCRAKNF